MNSKNRYQESCLSVRSEHVHKNKLGVKLDDVNINKNLLDFKQLLSY